MEASERGGVSLRIGPETLVRGHVADPPQDVTTVLGNLIDNAVSAAVGGSSTERWVEVELLDDVTQTGGTCTSWWAIRATAWGAWNRMRFSPRDLRRRNDRYARGAGQGLGLALVRQLARRRGGDVRVLEPGSHGGPGGAVFMASIPGVMDSAEHAGAGADLTLREDSNG